MYISFNFSLREGILGGANTRKYGTLIVLILKLKINNEIAIKNLNDNIR